MDVGVTAIIVRLSRTYVYGLAAGLTSLAAGGPYFGRRESVRVTYARFRAQAASFTLLLLTLAMGMIGAGIAVVVVVGGVETLGSAVGAHEGMAKTSSLVVSCVLVVAGTLLLAVRYGVAVPVHLFEDLGVSETLRRGCRNALAARRAVR
jgi:hypothetical protein